MVCAQSAICPKQSFSNVLNGSNRMPDLTFQYRLYPFGGQAETLEHWINSCRKIYNVALEQRKWARQMGRKVGYPQQQKELTELRAAFTEYRGYQPTFFRTRFCGLIAPSRTSSVDAENGRPGKRSSPAFRASRLATAIGVWSARIATITSGTVTSTSQSSVGSGWRCTVHCQRARSSRRVRSRRRPTAGMPH